MYQTLVIFLGAYLIWIEMLIAAVYIFNKSPSLKRDGMAVLLSFAAAYFVARIFGAFYSHLEPYVVNNFTPIIKHVTDNSFPSDHVNIASMIASFIFIKNRKLGLALFILAILVGVGRILGGVHYPIDIFFGLIAGILAVTIVNFAYLKKNNLTPAPKG